MLQTIRIKKILGLVLAMIRCFLITTIAQPFVGWRSLAEAYEQIPWQQELEDMVNNSELIVRGRASQTESYWQSDERGRHIYTTITIQSIAWSIGELAEESLVLEVVGGTVDEITESVSSVPAFRDGEDLILFLTGHPYSLYGGHRGKLNVYDDKVYWGGIELPAEAFLEALELITTGLSPESVWKRERQRRQAAPLASAPVITNITPNKGSAGTDTQMTITGSNFGNSRGTGKVEFFWFPNKPKVAAEIVSWSNTRIVCTVPVGEIDGYPASAGSGPVTVRTSSGVSNRKTFRVTFGLGLGGCKWHTSNIPVKYYINENTSDCTGEGNAIKRAANTWKNAAGGNFSFEYMGSHSITFAARNYRNEVMWNNNIYDVGETTTWTSAGKIVECDLVFNDDRNWSTSTTTSSNRWDVESVALHELGHWLTLEDLYGDVGDNEYDVGKVMYGFGSAGESDRILHADDIAGIRWIYPPYIDIGLRVYDGRAIIKIACEPEGTLTSPLRIAKNGVTYGIVLVDPSDPEASNIIVQTRSGPKALRKY
jgi:hypothetical protein